MGQARDRDRTVVKMGNTRVEGEGVPGCWRGDIGRGREGEKGRDQGGRSNLLPFCWH